MKTISLIDQIRASQAIYETAMNDIESMTDTELSIAMRVASPSTVARVLGIASDSTVDRVLGIASDSTVDRVLGIASDSTVARVASISKAVVPVIDDLDKMVLDSVGDDGAQLNMGNWHCGTTHCRAGWAITLAGDAGAELERLFGPETAGRLIYEASTGRPAPDFFASNAEALADIRRCAGVE